MARVGSLLVAFALLVCSGVAQAAVISPDANFIKTRPYEQLSTSNSIGALAPDPNHPEVWKASGIVPSVGYGLVAWADGRSGTVAIIGRDLTKPSESEFLISDETDGWQEGNPFVGAVGSIAGNTAPLDRRVVYDAAHVAVSGGDLGDIQGYRDLTSSTAWLYQTTVAKDRQRSPVFTNLSTEGPTVLSWIHYPETEPEYAGYDNTEIYTASFTTPATNVQNITPPTLTTPAAPRDSLAADGRYLVWQEMRYDGNLDDISWDVAVYDLVTTGLAYIDAPVAGKNQIHPDVSGDLVVWTQEEDPAVTKATNIFFQDLSSSSGPVAITTTGTAAEAAISEVDGNYFVVWQDYRLDGSTTIFPGGNGEPDFNWDIWGQEISIDPNTGDWALHDGGPFLIRADAGRQTNPDIDGLDVVWQSQAPDTEYIYVWGPIPEPCTTLVVAAGAAFLLAMRRKRGRRER